MKISLNWLNDFIDVTDYMDAPEKLADKLTAAGLEVEGVEKRGHFDHLKVGKILELKKHPDADKLTVCQVDVGDGEIRQIVCGATNHKQGDVVCAALPGCILPGDFKIKKSKIRGQESGGMLCSESELGLADTSEGIKILPANAPLGEDVSSYLGLRDSILEISVTPNRADCLSHWGLAREVSALLGRPLKELSPKVADNKTSIVIETEVKNTEACPRFTGRMLKKVKVAESPAWLKQRLSSCGMNSINNVVDITNYVMLELGQPMHAYDARFIEGQKILVENSHAGEVFTSFDGSEYVLTGEELCIRDAKKVIGLAGVVGSKDSGIQDTTTEVFLECAYFMPSSVRKTSRRFGIETDAGYRFSRGTDVDMVHMASLRATELFVEIAGAEVVSELSDVYPRPVTVKDIDVKVSDITERLGFEAEPQKFETWLKRLFCKFKKQGDTYTVTPPSFRYDFFCKEDLVEEYGRLEGYDQIPEILPQLDVFPTAQDPQYIQNKVMSDILVELGLNQAYNYNFSSSIEEAKLVGSIDAWLNPDMQASPIKSVVVKLQEDGTAVSANPLANFNLNELHDGESSPLLQLNSKIKVKNPLNENLDAMRSALAPQLFANALHNWKYGREYGQLFEVGSIFYKTTEGQYTEEGRVAAIAWGHQEQYWSKPPQQATSSLTVFGLRTTLESVFKKLGITSYKFQNIEQAHGSTPFFHPKQWARVIVEGKTVGIIGSVHPALLEEHKVRVPMAYFEIDPKLLFRGYPRYSKVKPLVYFPIVKRDMTFELEEVVSYDDLVQTLSKAVGKKLIRTELKDIYKGERLGQGRHAITVSLSLQDENKSIEDAELDKIQSSVFKAVETKFKK